MEPSSPTAQGYMEQVDQLQGQIDQISNQLGQADAIVETSEFPHHPAWLNVSQAQPEKIEEAEEEAGDSGDLLGRLRSMERNYRALLEVLSIKGLLEEIPA